MNEAKRAKVNSFLALVSELGDRMIKWSDKNKQNPDSWENITGDKLEDLQKVYKKRVFSFLTRGASVKKYGPKLKDMAEFVDTIHADVQKIREQLKELIEFANSPQAPEPAPESTSAPAQTGTLVEAYKLLPISSPKL
ncbi:hypothetical protein BASA83_012159 [Batrachochytrium salamandrivorans]|nr:hypothetical protein BASA83_012159 [Batrachochytrium salamandrivorans]